MIAGTILIGTGSVLLRPYGRYALVLNVETGATPARVEVQASPDGVAWSPLQR